MLSNAVRARLLRTNSEWPAVIDWAIVAIVAFTISSIGACLVG